MQSDGSTPPFVASSNSCRPCSSLSSLSSLTSLSSLSSLSLLDEFDAAKNEEVYSVAREQKEGLARSCSEVAWSEESPGKVIAYLKNHGMTSHAHTLWSEFRPERAHAHIKQHGMTAPLNDEDVATTSSTCKRKLNACKVVGCRHPACQTFQQRKQTSFAAVDEYMPNNSTCTVSTASSAK